MPKLSVSVDQDAGEVVVTWRSEALNPGSASELFFGFQPETSRDLSSWAGLGDKISARIGGGATGHEVRVPLAGAESFFRLRLSLDLAGSDLSGSDLSGLDLGGADLTGSNLSGADLSGTLLAGAKLEGVRLDSLGGVPGGRATEAIPFFPYNASATTFDPASLESEDTLLVFPQPGATIAEVNALIATHGGTIIGGFGGDPDQGEEGMLVVHFPALAPGSLPAIRQAFNDSPAVADAFEDALLRIDALPDLTFADPRWTSWGGSTRGGNWGLRLCRFPQAWNFNEAIHERIYSRGEAERFTRVEALTGEPTGNEALVANWPGRSFGSNYDGNISAPGVGVLSSIVGDRYAQYDGTSMAAPHVTGLVAFLYSVQPDLTKDEVMELIKVAAQPVSGASPRIDAFGAVMDIDKLREGEHILRALVDIDDRTEDGNQRIKMLAKTEEGADPLTFDTEAFDDDDYGSIGDGQVDMSDFRRFRDWNLLVMDEEGLIVASDSLDGPPTHPKNDPNRNRRTYNQDRYDRYYPRTDFNGDGLRYDPARSVPVAGVFNDTPQDDLQVFQRLFDDPVTDYSREDLPGLVASSDLHLSLYWFMRWNERSSEQLQIHQVRVRIQSRIARTERVYFIDVPEGAPQRGTHFLITLPAPDQHRVSVCGDAGGEVGEIVGELGENALVDFDSHFGRDLWFAPRVLFDGEPCDPN